MKVAFFTLVALLYAPLAGAHHSYASFTQDTPFVFSGTLTDVEWINPHILLSINDGAQTMVVEWVSLSGADRTGITREHFTLGEQLTVTGSRHRDPAIARMSLVKEVQMPASDLVWVSPFGLRAPDWLTEE